MTQHIKNSNKENDMDLIQGLLDSIFAVSVGIIIGVLADRLGFVDWLKGLVIRK